MFELGGDGQKQFFFVRAGDELDIDREPFGRAAHWQREARKAGEIQPLAEAHGVPIVVRLARCVVTCAVGKRRFGGNGGEQNRRAAKLAKDGGAHQVAIRACFLKGLDGDRSIGLRGFQIMAKHRAELRFATLRGATKQIGDGGAEEKPPEVKSSLQVIEFERFHGKV